MRRGRWTIAIAVVLALASVPALQFASTAQQPAAARNRFDFQVVESFDAKYLGDTPGHMGRGGKLVGKPEVALDDPVFRGETKIGSVTGLIWDRTKESLEVEFHPEPFEADASGRPIRVLRIAIGDDVWIPLHGSHEDAKKGR